jgi:hypothetical protein
MFMSYPANQISDSIAAVNADQAQNLVTLGLSNRARRMLKLVACVVHKAIAKTCSTNKARFQLIALTAGVIAWQHANACRLTKIGSQSPATAT